MADNTQHNTGPLLMEAENAAHDPHTFWLETGRNMVRGSIVAIDELAKQVITVSGILIGLYINAIALSSLRGSVSDFWAMLIYVSPLVLLFCSMLSGFMVFFPDKKRLDLESSTEARLIFNQSVKSKLRQARIASYCLLLSIIALFLAGIIYLRG
jgi:hypothetical protein